MGRPKAKPAEKKTAAVSLRMTAAERAIFDKLKASREQELEGEGVEVTDAGMLRWLFMREAIARGLDKGETPSTARTSGRKGAPKS
jgi:hypothetical protein